MTTHKHNSRWQYVMGLSRLTALACVLTAFGCKTGSDTGSAPKAAIAPRLAATGETLTQIAGTAQADTVKLDTAAETLKNLPNADATILVPAENVASTAQHLRDTVVEPLKTTVVKVRKITKLAGSADAELAALKDADAKKAAEQNRRQLMIVSGIALSFITVGLVLAVVFKIMSGALLAICGVVLYAISRFLVVDSWMIQAIGGVVVLAMLVYLAYIAFSHRKALEEEVNVMEFSKNQKWDDIKHHVSSAISPKTGKLIDGIRKRNRHTSLLAQSELSRKGNGNAASE